MYLKDIDGLYFIAEFNTSHFGDLELAKLMIEEAHKSGANCVKFQSWSTDSLYSKTYYDCNPIAKRFVKKYALAEDQLQTLAVYCKDVGIDFLSTPYSDSEVNFLLNECQAGAVKIASMEINNLEYLKSIARMNSQIFLSTGMACLGEIHTAVETLLEHGSGEICLLHCVSQYPTGLEAAQILNIKMLQNEFPKLLIGYSDHTVGFEAAAAAVALGAKVIERHFTLDKTKIGMDNNMASEPHDFKKLVEQCRNIKKSLGSYDRILTPQDYAQRKNMRRSIIYKKGLKAGHIISANDLGFKRPGTGLEPEKLRSVIGQTLLSDIEGDTLVKRSDWTN